MKTQSYLLLLLLLFSLWVWPYSAHAYYDPGVQHWINRDPIEEAGGINLFQFIAHNPISNIDVFGLMDIPTKDGKPQFPRQKTCWVEGATVVINDITDIRLIPVRVPYMPRCVRKGPWFIIDLQVCKQRLICKDRKWIPSGPAYDCQWTGMLQAVMGW